MSRGPSGPLLYYCIIRMTPLNEIKRKGTIRYSFKGMQMQNEPATVVDSSDQNMIAVCRDVDGQILNFVLNNGSWLLKGNTTQTSLLFGTLFVYNS